MVGGREIFTGNLQKQVSVSASSCFTSRALIGDWADDRWRFAYIGTKLVLPQGYALLNAGFTLVGRGKWSDGVVGVNGVMVW